MTTITWPREFISEAKLRLHQTGGPRVWGIEPEQYSLGCQNCGGAGFLSAWYADKGPFRDHPGGSAHWVAEVGGWLTGELHTAPCPVCKGGARAEHLARLTNLDAEGLTIRLADFKPMPGKTDALETAKMLLAMTPAPAGFVTFHGQFGRGKTMLLKALVNQFRLAAVPAAYYTMSDLLASVRADYGTDAPGAGERLISEYRRLRVLAIDEVDRINPTPWALETAFRLLDARYSAERAVLTILATNTDPANMDAMTWGYLASRMKSGIIVEVGGMDVRPAIGAAVAREVAYVG